MHTVAILVFDGVVAVDFVIPADAFGHTRLLDGAPGYVVTICGVTPFVNTTVCRMQVPHGLASLRNAHTIIVPGVSDANCVVDQKILDALKRAAARGTRIASICSGALVLARTGLLDGKSATTHWAAADILQKRHPAIAVDPAVLYVDNGQVLTSAGGMAGLDLCLHMIRKDYGAAVAASSARYAVMPLERSGGQAQFIVHEPPTPNRGDSLSETLEWMERNLKLDLDVPRIARHAAMSERTLARRFKEQTGTTPAKWVTRLRINRAQTLLETTPLSVERVAQTVGFGSAIAFRARFRELLGVSPLAYRRTFRAETRSHTSSLSSRV
jgi:transcriptional regulator GlxA family with amidase domain